MTEEEKVTAYNAEIAAQKLASVANLTDAEFDAQYSQLGAPPARKRAEQLGLSAGFHRTQAGNGAVIVDPATCSDAEFDAGWRALGKGRR